jgi:hypothetical protein
MREGGQRRKEGVMKLPRFTVDDVMSWGPCQDGPMDYSRKGVKRLFGRRKYGNARLVLDHPDIPDKDKLWVVLRPEAIPEKIRHMTAALRLEEKAGRIKGEATKVGGKRRKRNTYPDHAKISFL